MRRTFRCLQIFTRVLGVRRRHARNVSKKKCSAAREAWGFDGYITSDCGAENDVVRNHHFDNATAAVRYILRAGTDADCGGFMGGNAMQARNFSGARRRRTPRGPVSI